MHCQEFKKMKNIYCSIALFFISISLLAQIKGVVKDSLTGKPIPYVSIWMENQNIGATSDEDGTFEINTTEKNKNLIFSVLGFQKKKVILSKATIVFLNPTSYQLEEVVLLRKRKESRKKEIGNTDSQIFQAFDNGPRIDTKFFPYFLVYKKTKFIKQVVINTDSRIEKATIKIHFYSVDANGFPGAELLDRDFIVTVGKGAKETFFDVTKFNLKMPLNGIFIGFEKLIIEKNKFESTSVNTDSKTSQLKKTYFPFVLYNWVEKDFSFTFSGGKWSKQTQSESTDSEHKMKFYEPAINLILTN